MGACATKPEVLKEGETPEPAKEEVVVATGDDVQVEDKAVAVDEEEKKVVFEKDIGAAGGDKVEETEIVDDNKRRSLSNLFKESMVGAAIKQGKIDGLWLKVLDIHRRLVSSCTGCWGLDYSDHLFATNSIKLCQILWGVLRWILERIFQPLSYVPCILFLCNAIPYTPLHLHRLVHTTANWIGYSSAQWSMKDWC
ncbi:hypothetical protein D5086_032848 [Populus alba]|uniref:Uncharacterized protein n=1 Tax=Populus alba TaxID=43335 RepID=A0ACC4AG13_POPAL